MFEIYPSGDGYRFRFKGLNGEIMISGEQYSTKGNAKRAIRTLKFKVALASVIEIKD